MSVREAKLRSKLAALRGNAEGLYGFAEYLVGTVGAMSALKRGMPDNYRVLCPHYAGHLWWPVATGTKDYCIGVAETRNDRSIVVCGTFVCWPEDQWGNPVPVDADGFAHTGEILRGN